MKDILYDTTPDSTCLDFKLEVAFTPSDIIRDIRELESVYSSHSHDHIHSMMDEISSHSITT